jgi:hypothetical protein
MLNIIADALLLASRFGHSLDESVPNYPRRSPREFHEDNDVTSRINRADHRPHWNAPAGWRY